MPISTFKINCTVFIILVSYAIMVTDGYYFNSSEILPIGISLALISLGWLFYVNRTIKQNFICNFNDLSKSATLVIREQLKNDIAHLEGKVISLEKELKYWKFFAQEKNQSPTLQNHEIQKFVSRIPEKTAQSIIKDTDEINKLSFEIINISNKANLLSLNVAMEATKALELGCDLSTSAEEIAKFYNRISLVSSSITSVLDRINYQVQSLSEDSSYELNAKSA